MGTIVNLECVKCGYKKQLFIGGGLQDWDIEKVLFDFYKENYTDLYDEFLSNRNNLDSFSFSRNIALCNKCNEFYAIPVINFIDKNGIKHRIIGKCSSCNSKLVLCEESIIKNNNMECPKCKEKISFYESGYWD